VAYIFGPPCTCNRASAAVFCITKMKLTSSIQSHCLPRVSWVVPWWLTGYVDGLREFSSRRISQVACVWHSKSNSRRDCDWFFSSDWHLVFLTHSKSNDVVNAWSAYGRSRMASADGGTPQVSWRVIVLTQLIQPPTTPTTRTPLLVGNACKSVEWQIHLEPQSVIC